MHEPRVLIVDDPGPVAHVWQRFCADDYEKQFYLAKSPDGTQFVVYPNAGTLHAMDGSGRILSEVETDELGLLISPISEEEAVNIDVRVAPTVNDLLDRRLAEVKHLLAAKELRGLPPGTWAYTNDAAALRKLGIQRDGFSAHTKARKAAKAARKARRKNRK